MWFSKEFIAFSCHGKALKDLRIEYYEANEYDLTRLTSIQVFQKEIHFGNGFYNVAISIT